MAESNFDIDRLGMLSLEHFEYGVESDSSSGENAYSNSELSSNASSPPYFTDESESPLSSPTELNHSVKFWEDVSTVSLGVLQKDDNNIAYKSEEQPTCRYRRGTVIDSFEIKRLRDYSKYMKYTRARPCHVFWGTS